MPSNEIKINRFDFGAFGETSDANGDRDLLIRCVEFVLELFYFFIPFFAGKNILHKHKMFYLFGQVTLVT